MNRQQRRAAGQRRLVDPTALTAAEHYECPDCSAHTTLVQASPGVLVLEVRHDTTCPELARREHRR